MRTLHLRPRYSLSIPLFLSMILGIALPAAAYAAAPSTVPGCFPGANFSTTTGQPCTSGTVPNIAGCLPGFAFSTVTGQSCTTSISTPTTTTTTTVTATPGATPVITTSTSTATTVANLDMSGNAVFKAYSIPLLAGGTVQAGMTVPVSYLQVMNESSSTVPLKGFWIREDGTTPGDALIGFSSVDGKGTSRASVGGMEGSGVMKNNTAYVPSTAVFAPHEMKLFTIKAQLSASAARYAGTALKLNVTGIDVPATFTTSFPILGTTWTVTP